MLFFMLQICACFVLCLGQNEVIEDQNKTISQAKLSKFHDSMSNFSVELLYHAVHQQGNQNLIVSPFAAWTTLVLISEGAAGRTRQQVRSAIRFSKTGSSSKVRPYFKDIARWLTVNMTTARFRKFNGIFVHRPAWRDGINQDFRQISQEIYDTDAAGLLFKNDAIAAATINRAVSLTTEGWIPRIIDESDLNDAHMIFISGVYFAGRWTVPFNFTATVKRNFHNSSGEKIGEVNMMYNRYTHPFADIRELQARVIELPYGIDNHLSMILMLPDLGITLQDMFLNFKKAPLNKVFQELRASQEEHSDVEIDCIIPRFRIDSNLEMKEILKKGMGIYDLFDPKIVNLAIMSRWPIRAVNVIHKTEIDVTEESTTPSRNTFPEVGKNKNVERFEANRPFSFFVVEKHTNTVILAGVYQQPILY